MKIITIPIINQFSLCYADTTDILVSSLLIAK
jgi:hypothetical protein